MRFLIFGESHDVEMIGEEFEIPGTQERFAVHTTSDTDRDAGIGIWSATHIDTGHRVGHGSTIDGAIQAAIERWRSFSPEHRAEALAGRTALVAKRRKEKIMCKLETGMATCGCLEICGKRFSNKPFYENVALSMGQLQDRTSYQTSSAEAANSVPVLEAQLLALFRALDDRGQKTTLAMLAVAVKLHPRV